MEWNNTANSCDDFDKCAENLFCGNLVCNNTNLWFTCCQDDECGTVSCPNGFELDEAFDAWFDTDQCTELENVCGEQECKNTRGSYECECDSGFDVDIAEYEGSGEDQ